MTKKTFIIAIVLYLATTGISFFAFSHFLPAKVVIAPPPVKLTGGKLQFDPTLPKTEQCPLNGVKYSTQQRDWWQKHRPLSVMIENHEEARPQSGLSFADVVFEAVAEGGITRFDATFYCQDAPQIGPIRSARTYFIDHTSEYGDKPLYAHVGGANVSGLADALGQLDDYGWTGVNDLNQFSIGFPTFWRNYDRLDHPVATEHTMLSTTTKLWDFAAKDRHLTNVDKNGISWDKNFVPYTFKDDEPIKTSLQTIHLSFWKGGDAYAVDWTYDPTTNLYKRNNGGAPHLDFETKKQLTAKNVVILWEKELSANDGYADNIHLLYQNKGTGKATIFIDGKQINGTWKKATRTSKTLLFDQNGDPIKFDRGTIWFTVLPLTGEMSVK